MGSEPTTTTIHNHAGLLCRVGEDGQDEALGYIFHSPAYGSFAPSGRVPDISPEDIETHNALLSTMEKNAIIDQSPERVLAYVTGSLPWSSTGEPLPRDVTLWDGAKVGRILYHGRAHRALGHRRVWVRVRIGSSEYGGYRTESRDLVSLRRLT